MPVASEIGTLTSADDIERLADEWRVFRQAQANPLLTHCWFAAAIQLHARSRPRFLTARRDGQLVGIAPLAERRWNWVPMLELAGSTTLYEPGALLAADQSSLETLCEAMVGCRQPMALLRVARDGEVSRTFARNCRGRGHLFVVDSPPTLYVDLPGSFDAYLATRSKDLLAKVRRKFHRLHDLGPVQFESLRPAPEEIPAVLEEAIDVEADGWKGRAGSAMRHNPPIRRFVTSLAERFASSGGLRINFLRSGGSAIAMVILLEHGGALWGIKKGYRESARNTSPGTLLQHETLRYMCERGLHRYEFLGSGDPMQPDWATGERHLQTLVYYPYSLHGAAAIFGDIVSRFFRRRGHKLR